MSGAKARWGLGRRRAEEGVAPAAEEAQRDQAPAEDPLLALGASLRAAAADELADASLVLVFDGAGRVLLCSRGAPPDRAERESLAAALGDRDAAVRRGVTLHGRRLEVHRHHPPLVYGRSMLDAPPDESTGWAVRGVARGPGGAPCYAAATFEMPHTTARMVAALDAFCRRHLEAGPAA